MEIYSEALNGRTGHEAARALLRRLCGDREIAVTRRGKPYFVGGGPHFSISHTKSRAFCVLSDCPVGIDAGDQRLALLKLWVLKEAQAKATGEGLRGYPNKTDFRPDDPRLSVMDGHVVAVIEMR